ncbi:MULTISPECIES: protein translocase subunit SecF [Fusobacterium]|uniref:Protein-export membrane protein SecF n=2 Tax=Fusobacterium ulcerans TaxID=861 RepID=A0AAX1TSM3_9FUSO|nr:MULTISPECIES: protein translocase subunit SecF [Fusobacterium]AVQ27071.1 protein translocase subunit SecF [Fusobacterium ulcerans]EFS24800.1 protein-export membrane protein SecF [Fusobacterium ulcerans ATCC 49185]EPC09173.1 protein-export membrane protein SecF [Fusobacterium ulcerans 12-1B]MCB8565539.1 protein translocase subunit SecF [Fusobacterium ulcerans]MCB8649542.1 protein translocase subunit SecF [Fusobacterium ulcerans]
MQIKIIENSKKFVGLSLVIVVLSLGAFFTKGLNYGIDFSGGNLFQLRFENPITLNDINNNLDEISKEINQVNPNSRKVQISEDNTVIIRTPELTETEKTEVLDSLKKIGNFDVNKEEKVGASVGEELKTSAIYALGIGAFLIILYITFRFEFTFAVAAVAALFHDLIIAVGVISLLGYEVDTPFIAAILTILGYSINDTIVVFDRIRENMKRKNKISFEACLDKSVNQVMIRSINTSVTTLFAIIAILVFGGDSLKTFIVTLLIGILAGTYSSVFIATPLVYFLDKNKKGPNKGLHIFGEEKKKESKNEEKILV